MGLLHPPASKARPHPSEEFRERKRLHEVVVGSLVESLHAVFDGIPSSQYQNRSLQSALSQCGQHLQAISSREHKIQNDEIEFLLIDQEESFFSGGRDDHLIFLALQSLLEGTSHFRFVLHYENAQLSFLFLHFLPSSFSPERYRFSPRRFVRRGPEPPDRSDRNPRCFTEITGSSGRQLAERKFSTGVRNCQNVVPHSHRT